MNLKEQIRNFNDLNRKLRIEIANQSSLEHLFDLDKRMMDLLYEIRAYRSESVEELKAKMGVFLSMLDKDRNDLPNTLPLDALIDIMNSEMQGAFSQTSMHEQSRKDTTRPATSIPDIPYSTVNAFDMVGKSHDRISIVDTSFRYVTTSQKNGSFYRLKPYEIIGRHVGDLIGEQRFEGRARRFMEKTFDGERQQYFHRQNVEGNNRIMCCEMLPLYTSADSTRGLLVAMSDITDLVKSPDTLKLEELAA